MNLDEIRTEAAKMSIAIVMNGNTDTELLKYARPLEEYIRNGNISKTLVIQR